MDHLSKVPVVFLNSTMEISEIENLPSNSNWIDPSVCRIEKIHNENMVDELVEN